MLLSLVLFLKPESPSFPQEALGRAVHSFFLEQVRRYDPALGQELHDGSSAKPFAISDLHRSRGEESLAPFWVRIAAFSEPLSRVIQEQVTPNLPEKIVLGDFTFTIAGHTLDPNLHLWAGNTTYEALIGEQMLATRSPAGTFDLSFATPTTFHVSGDKHQPFPLPELLLGSWLNRWNAFAPIAFPEDVRNFASSGLAVSRYNLQTEALHYGKATYIGFTGRCSFRFLSDDPYWLRLVHTLAHFAFFCGSGHKTTQGMGMTRRTDVRF